MIQLRLERRLDVAAASGLVERAGRLYVIADDDLALAVYPIDGGPAERIALAPGELPADRAARKAAKPDHEAIALLPGERLLVVPSGSRRNRVAGAEVDLASGAVRAVDFAPLYERLLRDLPELNIEGAVAAGDRLRLLQRGNGRSAHNAIVDLDLGGALAALAAGAPLDPALLRAIAPVDLGARDGVVYGFTDGSPLPDGRLLVTAAAEAGGDTYLDGAQAGAAIGLIDGTELRWLEPVDQLVKLEGVHAAADGRLWLVADADDPAVPAPLFSAQVRLPPRR